MNTTEQDLARNAFWTSIFGLEYSVANRNKKHKMKREYAAQMGLQPHQLSMSDLVKAKQMLTSNTFTSFDVNTGYMDSLDQIKGQSVTFSIVDDPCHFYGDITKTNNKGIKPMCYDCDEFNTVTTPTEASEKKRQYIRSKLDASAAEKRAELYEKFMNDTDSYPTTYKEAREKLISGAFKLWCEERFQEDQPLPYGALSNISFVKKGFKVDKEGYEKACSKLNEQVEALTDEIAISDDFADLMKKVQAFEDAKI